MRLQIKYIVQITDVDGLDNMCIEFVPWQNGKFHIVSIKTQQWIDSLYPERVSRYHTLSSFSSEKKEQIKKLLLEEWNRHLSFLKNENLYPILSQCKLVDSTRKI